MVAEATEDDYEGSMGDTGVALQEYHFAYGIIGEGRFGLLVGKEVNLCAFHTIGRAIVRDAEKEETRVCEGLYFSLGVELREGVKEQASPLGIDGSH